MGGNDGGEVYIKQIDDTRIITLQLRWCDCFTIIEALNEVAYRLDDSDEIGKIREESLNKLVTMIGATMAGRSPPNR